jgi:hypothetical protein
VPRTAASRRRPVTIFPCSGCLRRPRGAATAGGGRPPSLARSGCRAGLLVGCWPVAEKGDA